MGMAAVAVSLAAAAAGMTGLFGSDASAAAASSPPPLSSTPKEVLIDPNTGTVESVTQLSASEYQALLSAAAQASGTSGSGASPDISNHNICTGGDACYYTDHTPYADQGFWGSAGTFNGSWPYRNAFDTGSYTAQACWSSHCTGKWGPNTYISLTSDVTGTSVTIY